MDAERYEKYRLKKEEEFESICKRCGECCGALDDPCRNLVRLDDGAYFCRDYANRFGPQMTVSGNTFTCVPIREHISKSTLRQNCAYRGSKDLTHVSDEKRRDL
ncbi:MAG: hypothetical protein DRP85_02330 [Candidatus Makaraimicrobium thalassicum]|nr:MAG: hypothetical protein DRP85_02330 [Candidatus Omnitrophota bacterium]